MPPPGKVKGLGCGPIVTYPSVLRAGVRKPPRKEPAGAGGRSASMGIWWGAGSRRGSAGWRMWQRIDDHGGELGAAAAVGRAILT